MVKHPGAAFTTGTLDQAICDHGDTLVNVREASPPTWWPDPTVIAGVSLDLAIQRLDHVRRCWGRVGAYLRPSLTSDQGIPGAHDHAHDPAPTGSGR